MFHHPFRSVCAVVALGLGLTAASAALGSALMIPAGFPVVGHQIYYRDKSQSGWEHFPANLSINFTAECGKRE